MEMWWNNLILPLQIFYGLGILAAIVLGIDVLLTVFGVHHHALADGLDHPDGLGLVSVRTLTGFFFGFGWTGAICIKSGLGMLPTILIACAVGGAFLLGIYLLMRALFSMRASGTLDYANAIGTNATVYVTVPPGRGGSGQVEVMIQGRLQTIACMTSHPEPLAPQTKVRVTGQIDQGTLEVQPL
jgi:hypothetical protein